MIARLLPASAVRPMCLLLGGATGLGLVVVALTPAAPHRRPGRPVVEVERPTPAAVPSASAGRDDARDAAALAYYRSAAPEIAGHVREVIWTTPILRVYTDLPASDANSPTALALCRTGAAYLQVRGRTPVVFVHARDRDGFPVLANKIDAGDSCRLDPVP